MPRQDDPLTAAWKAAQQKPGSTGKRDPLDIAWQLAQVDKSDYTTVDKIGALAQTFSDAATFGLSGLADDALTALLSKESFKDVRSARRAGGASLPAGVRTAAQLAGALATPLPGAGLAGRAGLRFGGTLVRQAPQTAKLLSRTGRAAADAAAQAGIAGTVSNLDELSVGGVGSALQRGAGAAALGGAIGGGAGSAAEMGVRAYKRVGGMGALDKAAFKIVDDMKKLDKANYGAAAGEAISTAPIRNVLNDDLIVAPIAKEIRAEAAYQGKPMTDAEALMAAYRRVSAQQRRAQASLEHAKVGDVGYDPKLSEGTVENLKTAKGHMLAAVEAPSEVVTLGRAVTSGPPTTAQSPAPSLREALNTFQERIAEAARRSEGGTVAQQSAREALERHAAEGIVSPPLSGAPSKARVVTRPSETLQIGPGIPSLRKAIESHRAKSGELKALQEGADIGLSVARSKSIPGKKLTTTSQEAYLRKIPGMSDAEAEAALAGILGRFPEQMSLTSSPLGLFGLVTSAVRSPLTAYRTMPIIRALEEKLGRGDMGQGVSDATRGTLSRLIGMIEAQQSPSTSPTQRDRPR